MSFAHLTIKPEGGPDITAQFNPEKYTHNKSVQFAEVAIPGLDAPVVQFVRGQAEKITLDLFFDTTEHGIAEDARDVRDKTGSVYKLAKVNGDTHAPLRCRLEWGEGKHLFWVGAGKSPWCVVESVNEEFTLFSPQGMPLRAKLTVTFREALTIADQLQETPRHSSDRTKFYVMRRGETLSHIAFSHFQDPGDWRVIAEANQIANPRLVQPGLRLTIPRRVRE
jgi:nucleoid-associated protein YgaU